jgi:hypothetical protein
LIWIFPIAGRGTRTVIYGKFKPFIPVLGRKILHWCLTGIHPLIGPHDRFVFITTREFEVEFSVKRELEALFVEVGLAQHLDFVLAPDTPPGPAASVHLAGRLLDEDTPCTVINADQLVQYKHRTNLGVHEGYVPLYVNSTGKSSYVTIEDCRITGIFEKDMRSHYASAGVYTLGSARTLIKVIEESFTRGITHNGEYYVGPALNHFISGGGILWPAQVFMKIDLGSIEGIDFFTRSWQGLLGFC